MFASNSSHLQEEPNYIESCFSTWLYTGNGSTQTITNGIDLAGNGGLTWIKSRSYVDTHRIFDTARGVYNYLDSASTAAQNSNSSSLTAFNANGFSIGASTGVNQNTSTYASWTFREQPKFFDVVTYTGNGSTSARSIPHSLGSAPGFIIVKRTDTTSDWAVWHRSVSSYGKLNSTAAFVSGASVTNGYVSGSAVFGDNTQNFFVNTVPPNTVNDVNASGGTYVAYLFAHNAGGFGLTGTDNVISCGSYSGNGSASGPTVTLGYEPQWVMIKRASGGAADWVVFDNMRGMPVGLVDATLRPNTSDAETAATDSINPTATGFYLSDSNSNVNSASSTYIYIAIRRGPMKTPTSGTSVYNAVTWTGNNTTGRTLAHGLSSPPDLSITQWRDGDQINLLWDKLRGFSTTASGDSVYLRTPSTGGESLLGDYYYIPDMVNVAFGSVAGGSIQLNSSSSTLVGWNFRRAPGFFDEVCYTGTGSATTQAHNLGVVPELMIVKSRSASGSWAVYSAALGNTGIVFLDLTVANSGPDTQWNSTTPTATVFSVGSSSEVNFSGRTYVAYLFASCPGVSKVGSYTGTGTTQQINCGFTAGARFVLIKRTDSTGDWYVWDTARGIVSANDPRLSLNSTAAEVTTDDSIDPDNSGFIVNQVSATNINVSSATYIYLAIA